MTDTTIYPTLEIPHTLAAGPGPGNTDPRVLERFAAAGVADHMQADVLRGMVEAKLMLREVWGTDNVHTFGVAGTGWSGLDAMMSAVAAGDSVVAFANGDETRAERCLSLTDEFAVTGRLHCPSTDIERHRVITKKRKKTHLARWFVRRRCRQDPANPAQMRQRLEIGCNRR